MAKLRFTQDAGERLLNLRAASKVEVEQAITQHISSYGLAVDGLQIAYEENAHIVSIHGRVADNQTREKVMLCAGNIDGIACVDDFMQVEEDESTRIDWYTVKPGDTIQSLSRFFLRDYQKYMEIVEANAPMFTNPSLLYPGQMLRIPPEPRRCVEPTVIRRKSVFA